MIPHQTHNDLTNWSDSIFLRQVIIGILAYFQGRIGWINRFETGPETVIVPFYYPLAGQNRWVLDAFKDDIPDVRVDSNTDKTPRGTITLKNWQFKMDEIANPNVWINNQVELDTELAEKISQVRSMPVKLQFEVEIMVDTEIDQFKAWQSMATVLSMYRYFTFDFKRLPLRAQLMFPTDFDNVIPRDFINLGDVNRYKIQYQFDVHTHFPIFDRLTEYPTNRGVEWILRMWTDNDFIQIPEDKQLPTDE